MPTAVQLANAAFVTPLYKPLPTIPGLVAWSYWGKSLTDSQNVIAGGPYSNFGGGPAWSPAYGHCVSGVSQIQSSGAGANAIAQTVMMVTRYVPGGSGGASSQVSAGIAMSCQLIAGGANAQMTASGVAQPTPVVLTVPNTTLWKFYAFQAGGGNAAFIYNLTDATNASGGTAGNITNAAGNATFGGGAPGVNNQQCDVAFLAYAHAFTPKALIDQVYAHVKDVINQRSSGQILV